MVAGLKDNMGRVLVVLNFIVVISAYVEFFLRDSSYIDFGFTGLTLFYLEAVAGVLFMVAKKNIYDIIAFIVSVLLAVFYFKMAG